MRALWKGFRKGFERFGHDISVIVNTILLSLVYFLGVGTSSALIRIAGVRHLRPQKKDAETYWIDLSLGKEELERYHRQF